MECAERFGLRFCFDNDAPVEVLMNIPVQTGLSLEVSVNLQNWDELWLEVGDCVFCMFSFDETRELFRDCIEGLISGNARIVRHLQGPWNSKRGASLQLKRGSSWQTVASQTNWFRMPLFSQSEEILLNEEASVHSQLEE